MSALKTLYVFDFASVYSNQLLSSAVFVVFLTTEIT